MILEESLAGSPLVQIVRQRLQAALTQDKLPGVSSNDILRQVVMIVEGAALTIPMNVYLGKGTEIGGIGVASMWFQCYAN